jgi:hypothetical protein
MGSPLGWLRKNLDDFPHQPFLIPDSERVAQYRERLAQGGPALTVGICWRSMMLDVKRAKYFSALDSWGAVLKTPGVRFVNLQYGDCSEELKRAEALHGIKIDVIEGLNLKDDIDGAAAASAAVDLVISAPTAAAAVAAAVGTEVWYLTAGRTWPQLGTDEYPWYRKAPVFAPEKFGDWTSLMPRVADALKARAAK